ncbi:MAG: ADP-glyceromanno-heptose 6-epimerase [Verrucomicrobia bacterium]|nr:ADP-glyceromanno-heptose 6-epimerase [Verrucomicrobiota bacterium]
MSNWSKGDLVVTGGAGLIGSALIWGLNNRNIENIWLVDSQESNDEKNKNLAPLSFSRHLSPEDFRKLVRENSDELSSISTIFHLGACSSTTETNEAYLDDNNLGYTRELCEWSLEHGVRFVYASSASTYGDGSLGMDDQDLDLAKFQPLNLYGWSKHKFDLLAKENQWLEHIVGLKYFNVYGPNEEHKGDMRSVVSKAYEQIASTGEMTLFKSYHPDYGDGEQMRDFLYVKDAVLMTIWLAESTRANGLFNLGNGQARTWLDLGHSIFSALGTDSNIRFIEMPEILRDKYQYFTEAKIDKLRHAGYTNELFALEDAVKDYVTQYLVPGRRLGS